MGCVPCELLEGSVGASEAALLPPFHPQQLGRREDAGCGRAGEGRPTPGSQRVAATTPCDSWGLFSFPLVWPMNEIF